ncbi:hypothetical protein D8674_034075 [Pyrus ussuriensis x Pyrus communis]|uniref:Uncharacterized protein n=1 Tax=Pyrus ussuriensis x Pyrus communis TaxID=2448454 RepID=A0A5N5HUQ8_9ROSA|nr:hypothetical protein D8674_034075 [Pyrus ussuriensis x Pyrus communis]
MGESRSSERRLRLPADYQSMTVPVNIDQNASNKIAAKAQKLYQPFRSIRPDSELPFFALQVPSLLEGRGHPSLRINPTHIEFI